MQGFVWDTGNKDKNQAKHKIKIEEAEELFFDSKYIMVKDNLHSLKEYRFIIIGVSKSNRLLTIAFTVRSNMIRVISARPASKREKIIYEKATKDS